MSVLLYLFIYLAFPNSCFCQLNFNWYQFHSQLKHFLFHGSFSPIVGPILLVHSKLMSVIDMAKNLISLKLFSPFITSFFAIRKESESKPPLFISVLTVVFTGTLHSLISFTISLQYFLLSSSSPWVNCSYYECCLKTNCP